MDVVKSAQAMVAGMAPELQPGLFVFATVPVAQGQTLLAEARASCQEAEGLSLILPIAGARAAGLACAHRMQCITLNVYSALDGFGLTAAVATALAEAEIPCNMVAAFHHDHAFVPANQSKRALAILCALQMQAAQES